MILDFDGTLTDVEKEAELFIPTFRRELELRLEMDISRQWEKAEQAIAAAPERYGWEYGGVIIASATADPYIRATTIAGLVVSDTGGFTNARDRSELIAGIYRKSYAATTTVFRPEAAHVLHYLHQAHTAVSLVTNAHPEVVRAKLDPLLHDGLERIPVYGDARKYALVMPSSESPLFSALPETTPAFGPGYRRVWLRRGAYFDVLRRIWRETETTPADTLVCGDIFELDLAMPAALGCSVHLIAHAGTLPYEIAAIEALEGRGKVSATLWGIAAHVLGIPQTLRTGDGCVIRVPPNAREHLVAHPETIGHLAAAAQRVSAQGVTDYLDVEVDLGCEIGSPGFLPTPRIRANERAQFALRPNRPAPSRVVKTAAPQTSVLSIRAQRGETGDLELLTAHAGHLAPPEPWDAKALSKLELSLDAVLGFWCSHALVWQPEWPEPFESTWIDVLNTVKESIPASLSSN